MIQLSREQALDAILNLKLLALSGIITITSKEFRTSLIWSHTFKYLSSVPAQTSDDEKLLIQYDTMVNEEWAHTRRVRILIAIIKFILRCDAKISSILRR